MSNFSNGVPKDKPKKPRADFPLFPHATGRWAKKIKGRFVYFGPWSDPDGALQKYLDQKNDLYAGRTPRDPGEGLTVRELCNRFLTWKRELVENGELSEITWRDYHIACGHIVDVFGRDRAVAHLRSEDFQGLRRRLAKRCGPVRLGNEIQRIRSVFLYAYDEELIDKPVRYGKVFKRPSKKTLRLARNAAGPRMFEPEEIQAMLREAGIALRAMILLGVNCGYGNSDVGRLTRDAINLESGWADFPRPKTGVQRRCPLWPETVAALREALEHRPTPKDPKHVGLVFVTKRGGCWAKSGCDNPVSKETAKLLKKLNINGHRNFYCLRHVLETIGGESRDQVAGDSIMGRARDDMASVYRERISDERLKAVTDHVRAWLFPET
jgi:integrase